MHLLSRPYQIVRCPFLSAPQAQHGNELQVKSGARFFRIQVR